MEVIRIDNLDDFINLPKAVDPSLELNIDDVDDNVDFAPVDLQPPKTEDDFAVTSIIHNMIEDAHKAVDNYNGAIVTLHSLNVPYEQLEDVLVSISNDYFKHIGQQEEVLKTVSPNAVNIDLGQEEVAPDVDDLTEDYEVRQDIVDAAEQDYKENSFGYDGLKDYVETNFFHIPKESREELLKKLKNVLNEVLNEDTIKQDGKWVNKGKEGTHGEFRTKKQADAHRRAMFAQGYQTESLNNEQTNTVYQYLKLFMDSKGYDMKDHDSLQYISEAAEYIAYSDEFYPVEEWYKDTKINYPEDLKGLKLKTSSEKKEKEESGNLNEGVITGFWCPECDHKTVNQTLMVVDDPRQKNAPVYVCDNCESKFFMNKNNELKNLPEYVKTKRFDESCNKKSKGKELNESVESYYFKAFITNLGKYNEGELVGEWVEFPIDEY